MGGVIDLQDGILGRTAKLGGKHPKGTEEQKADARKLQEKEALRERLRKDQT